MKVLYITTAYPRSESDVITPWLVETVQRLQNNGVQVTVFTSSYKGLGNQTIFGTRVIRFRYFFARWENLTHDETAIDRVRKGFLNKILALSYLVCGTIAIWRLCRNEKFDIIHIHWPLPHFLFGYVAAKLYRAPTVISFHGAELMAVRHKFKILRPFVRWAIARASRITANSTYTVQAIQSILNRPVDIVPFGAGLPENLRNPTNQPQSQNEYNILFVGRLVERKGVHHLIEAAAILKQKLPVKINIVGSGPEMNRLQQLTRQLKLEDTVLFHGQVSPQQLQHHYQTCSVFVLPAVIDSKGDTEGLGVVLIEALTYQKPVVASGVGGITDIIINEKTGITVPPGDSAKLAAAIERLLTDRELASRLAAAGYHHIQMNYSWTTIVQRLIGIYQQLLAETRT
ncbi:glycosyltransferase family 4 protein [candidate division WOR-3 bacterium]|nr:glycosyltransferase family 4 protein [candidate division WOR-3 bacterium]